MNIALLQPPHPPQAVGAVLNSESDIQVAAAVALSLALRLLCGCFFHVLLQCIHKWFIETLSLCCLKVLTAHCLYHVLIDIKNGNVPLDFALAGNLLLSTISRKHV